jgi:hypothetical protein
VDRPWNRPEHWSAREVGYLENRFGRTSDEAIGRHLGRSVTGVRLKAKGLGLRKRDVAMTAYEVARRLGAEPTTVSRIWIRRGLLRARRGYPIGGSRAWLVEEEDLWRFLEEHPQYVDADRIPADSPYTCERWLSLPEIHRLTGRMTVAENEIRNGTVRAAKRGVRWYVPEADLPEIRRLAPSAVAESVFRRENVLAMRRARRKGIAA